MAFSFFSEEIEFTLSHSESLEPWLISSIDAENKYPGEITFIFCSDEYLLKLNQDYLKHDTLTDIITFDYSMDDLVSGDIYISIPRVTENADIFKCSFQDELHRVMIHGVLHLLGYKDKTPNNKAIMRGKEDYYLTLRTFL